MNGQLEEAEKMKKLVISLSAALAAATMAFGQPVPENRSLYVGVWKFAEENNYQDAGKYTRQIERFLKNEILSDTKINAKTGETTYEKSFDFKKGNFLDIDSDEYRILTPQLSKTLASNTLHIFDWSISSQDGIISVKLNNALTAIVDKNGDWTSSSKFQKSKIANAKKIQQMAAKDIEKYLAVSDDEYEAYRKEVVSDINFLSSVVPNMTELSLDDFIQTNGIYEIPTTITLKVFDVSKNDFSVEGYTPDKYAYKIYGTNGSNYIWGFSNATVFNKAKKDTEFSCAGTIRSIKNKMN
ncbi:MAG: hypothetical protein K2H09_05805, partial [Treponemataceae bacterium]|nr:hypothetical protein [Treponemataceae bacterium]